MSNFKSIGQGVRGLRPPEIGGFPLTLSVALTTVLRTNVLHCDNDFKHSLTTSVLIKFCKLFLCNAVVLLMYRSVLYSFIAM